MFRFIVYLVAFLLIAPVSLAGRVYPADPDTSSKQWHLEKIKAYDAWARTKGSNEIVVAVIDTGVDINHPDLVQNIWTNPREIVDGLDNDRNVYIDDTHGWDFVDGDNDPSPNINEDFATAKAINHGTAVAGLIGAVGNNGIGVTGVAWNVKMMPLRALDSRGRGNVSTIIEAIRYAIRENVDIINLSFVGPGFDRDLFLVLQEATRKGILVVAAVGNNEDGKGTDLDKAPLYPVCYTGAAGEDVVLGVAALDKDDKKSMFSNYGANCVDISAPGVEMYSTVYHSPNRGFVNYFEGDFSGSSMAAPLVSGTAALIKSLNPSYSPQEIKNILLQSANPIDKLNPEYEKKLGIGSLNAQAAIELAVSGAGSMSGSLLASGSSYVLVAPLANSKPEVQILSPSGTRVSSFMAYAETFKAGVKISSGDVNQDGIKEIVVGTGSGGGPQVRVFKSDGTLISSFFAYDKNFRGGVNVAVGDINGNGKAEIVTAAGPGGGPQIRIFDQTGKAVGGFFAYGKGLNGGANLTVEDLDNDGKAEIIVGPGKGAGSDGTIRVFDSNGKIKISFAQYPSSYANGIQVAVGDIDGDSQKEIITAPAVSQLSEIRVYSNAGQWERSFKVYNNSFDSGISIAAGDLDRDGISEIIAGPGKGKSSDLMILDGFGKVRGNFPLMPQGFQGGVNVDIIEM